MRFVQLFLIVLPVTGLFVTVPAVSSPFNGASLQSLNGADRTVHTAAFRSYYRYGYRYGRRRCQTSPAEC